MLTIKKRSGALMALAIVLSAIMTACSPPGARDLREGEELIQTGHAADAIPVLKEAVDTLRSSAPRVQATAWNLLGLAYQGAGQLDPASRAYLQALKFDRNLWEADYNLGCLRMQQQNIPGAIDYFTTYVTSHPKDINAVLLLSRARLDYALGRTGADKSRQLIAARTYYQYAEQLQSTAEACNALGLIELEFKNPNSEAINRAAYYFRLALQRDPNYAPALLNLGIVSQRYLNDPRGALDAYQKYLATTPPPANAAEIQSIAHQLDLSLRINLVEQHPATVPTNPAPVRASTVATERPAPRQPAPAFAKPPEPVATVKTQYALPPVTIPQPRSSPTPEQPAPVSPPVATTTTTATPSSDVATSSPNVSTEQTSASDSSPPPTEEKRSFVHKLNPLTWFSSRSKKSEPPEIPIPSEPAQSDRYTYPLPVLPIPGDRKLAEQLTHEGHLAERQSNRGQAIQDYEQAVRADPTYYDAALALGLAAIDAKEYSTALDSLGQALNLQADSSDARYAFAWALGKKGYYQDAVNELEKLLDEHPNEARAHILLGNFYAENLRETNKAREQYLKAVALLGPQSPQAVGIQAWLDQHP